MVNKPLFFSANFCHDNEKPAHQPGGVVPGSVVLSNRVKIKFTDLAKDRWIHHQRPRD